MAHDDDSLPPPFSGLNERVDRLHTEHKVFRDQTTQNIHLHDTRLTKLEFLDQQKQERMAEGSKTFQALRDQISLPWWKILLAVGPGFGALLGLAYSAGKMPSGDDYRVVQQEVQELKINYAKMEGLLRKIDESMQDQKATNAAISRKLDELAKRP